MMQWVNHGSNSEDSESVPMPKAREYSAMTIDSDWDVTGKLAKIWLSCSNGVSWTNDLTNSDTPEVIYPTIVPASKDE